MGKQCRNGYIIPKHVGIIPDGTRRWARENGMGYTEAYQKTASNLGLIIDYLFSRNVSTISVYVLSRENLNRSEENLRAIFEAIVFFCREVLSSLIKKWSCQVNLAGSINYLPDKVAADLLNIEQWTRRNALPRLNLLVAYHPVDEILYALSKTGSPQDFISRLWVTESVDLIIRTAGVCLLSNFLPLQSGYARIYVFDKLFNDLTIQDMDKVLEEFALIPSRYGL